MEQINLKDYDHDYYCSDSNYYSNDARLRYESWYDFHKEFFDCDIDLNLIFRWDIQKKDNGSFFLELFMIQQRKGIFTPIIIETFEEYNIEEFENFISKHWEKLKDIWNPISKKDKK